MLVVARGVYLGSRSWEKDGRKYTIVNIGCQEEFQTVGIFVPQDRVGLLSGISDRQEVELQLDVRPGFRGGTSISLRGIQPKK